MSLWIKLSINFFTHRKTVKLRGLIGDDAYWIPPRLWTYAASNQPDGDFKDYSAAELATVVGYSKDASSMLQALLQAGFLDSDMKIHDWEKHNGFHKVYTERARKGGFAKNQKERIEKENKLEERRGEEPSTALRMPQAVLQAQKPPNGEKKVYVNERHRQIEYAKQRMKAIGDKLQPTEQEMEEYGRLGKDIEAWTQEILTA